ncbi:PQQ-binding-like beta-propeller repeat protein [Streptomyces sp. ISL-43]|uniref:outer membrane protein assembly factor BamB family protein n=1 Tax=Streptomyces sp. ISL-43 TaxID=2819183 RepID=UPI001BED1FB8|nr:PQQ-binding-like beta-propeller repeat protein [Streptomyces sp. ISL-43]MBT2448313.1 PQQ-binding-like beta-propeller repeat protein [Streptomyces sp. ISL-43]
MRRAGGQQQNVGRRQVLKLATGAVGGLALTTSACGALGGAPEEAKPPARKPLWTLALLDKDGSSKGLDHAAVVHQDGVVYVRSKKDGLYAIDAATGRERWCSPLAGALPGAPAVTSSGRGRRAMASAQVWRWLLVPSWWPAISSLNQ